MAIYLTREMIVPAFSTYLPTGEVRDADTLDQAIAYGTPTVDFEVYNRDGECVYIGYVD